MAFSLKIHLSLIAIAVSILQISSLQMGFSPDPRFVEQMTALNYGDPCANENEEARQQFATKLTSTDMREAFGAHKKWQETVVNENLLFCNAMKLLICDKVSQKCICGDSGNRGLSMSTYKESNYVAEMRGNMTMCKMQAGAYCSPIDMFQSQEPQCVTGTSCTSTTEGGLCTSRTLGGFLYSNQHRSKQELADDTFMGKICSCRMTGGGQNQIMSGGHNQNQNDQMMGGGHMQMQNAQQMMQMNSRNTQIQSANQNQNQMHHATAKPSAKLVVQKREAGDFHSSKEVLGDMFNAFSLNV